MKSPQKKKKSFQWRAFEWLIRVYMRQAAWPEFKVLMVHLLHADKNGVAWPGMETITDMSGNRQQRTAERAMDNVVKAGLLQTIDNEDGGRGKCAVRKLVIPIGNPVNKNPGARRAKPRRTAPINPGARRAKTPAHGAVHIRKNRPRNCSKEQTKELSPVEREIFNAIRTFLGDQAATRLAGVAIANNRDADFVGRCIATMHAKNGQVRDRSAYLGTMLANGLHATPATSDAAFQRDPITPEVISAFTGATT